MSLLALVDGMLARVVAGGPRHGLCAECAGVMRARAGPVRIWHWAHVARNPHCEAARESEWHLAWKILGADGTQEVRVGARRADVLAPGGFAVEFQASALDAAEVRAREDDWGAQGALVWVFRADREFGAGRIVLAGSFRGWDECLLQPENRATLDVTWFHAPERVRAAHAPSFLDLGGGQLLFVGAWRQDSQPLSGYGWRVSRDWVVGHVLRGGVVPAPLAEDPVKVVRRLAEWTRRENERVRRQRARPAGGVEPEERVRRYEEMFRRARRARPGLGEGC
jgi:Competence protein CoiA-like family